MNERFYALPPERQQAIINAGYLVFSQNSYKKASMGELAARAGVSKSLLFYYFRNKRELYLFLWERGAQITIEYLDAYHCYDPTDLFEMMERGMQAKFHLIQRYPHMAAFTIKAFYEKDAAVAPEVQRSYRAHLDGKASSALSALDPEAFVPGLDLQLMYREMYWASEGYLWEMLQRGDLDARQMEADFRQLLAFWKRIYLRRDAP